MPSEDAESLAAIESRGEPLPYPPSKKNRHFPLEKIFKKMARFFAQTAM
jgi:hypothetical protein